MSRTIPMKNIQLDNVIAKARVLNFLVSMYIQHYRDIFSHSRKTLPVVYRCHKASDAGKE